MRSATLAIWLLAERWPAWWKTSRTGGCTRSYSSEAGADQRVRHSGFSMPSVSFSCRWKNRAYLSNFWAMKTALSVQLSASMNSSGTPASGAVRTTSARALLIAGFFQVPFTGSATSVA
ncbi:hypothetical protein [Streptomyces sp. NPDC001135]